MTRVLVRVCSSLTKVSETEGTKTPMQMPTLNRSDSVGYMRVFAVMDTGRRRRLPDYILNERLVVAMANGLPAGRLKFEDAAHRGCPATFPNRPL